MSNASSCDLLLFSCPSCTQRLAVPCELGGATAPCPYCGHEFRAPELLRVATLATPAETDESPQGRSGALPGQPAGSPATPAAAPGVPASRRPGGCLGQAERTPIQAGEFAAAKRRDPARRRRRRRGETAAPLDFEQQRRRPTRATRLRRTRSTLRFTVRLLACLVAISLGIAVAVKKFVPSGARTAGEHPGSPRLDAAIPVSPRERFRTLAIASLNQWVQQHRGGLMLVPRNAEAGSVPRCAELRELRPMPLELEESLLPERDACLWSWSGGPGEGDDLVALVYRDQGGAARVHEDLLHQTGANRLERLARDGVADELPYFVTLRLDPDLAVPADCPGRVGLSVGFPFAEQAPGRAFISKNHELAQQLQRDLHDDAPPRRATVRLASRGPGQPWRLLSLLDWGWSDLDFDPQRSTSLAVDALPPAAGDATAHAPPDPAGPAPGRAPGATPVAREPAPEAASVEPDPTDDSAGTAESDDPRMRTVNTPRLGPLPEGWALGGERWPQLPDEQAAPPLPEGEDPRRSSDLGIFAGGPLP